MCCRGDSPLPSPRNWYVFVRASCTINVCFDVLKMQASGRDLKYQYDLKVVWISDMPDDSSGEIMWGCTIPKFNDTVGFSDHLSNADMCVMDYCLVQRLLRDSHAGEESYSAGGLEKKEGILYRQCACVCILRVYASRASKFTTFFRLIGCSQWL